MASPILFHCTATVLHRSLVEAPGVVAQFTFVPAAGAVMADWGADVIKVEHAVTGDAQRGLGQLGVLRVGGGAVNPVMEHAR